MGNTEETVFDAVKREVIEETALEVKNITGAVRTFSYTMEKVVKDDATAEDKVTSISSIQFNFICETNLDNVRVNIEEHSGGMFASLEELEEVDCTDEMRTTVRAAFLEIANE